MVNYERPRAPFTNSASEQSRLWILVARQSAERLQVCCGVFAEVRILTRVRLIGFVVLAGISHEGLKKSSVGEIKETRKGRQSWHSDFAKSVK